MDLGITDRSALVCASSKGLGAACAMSLAREGVNVTLISRGEEALMRKADEIRQATSVRVTPVVGDITSEAGRRAALEACPSPDILINNAGGPPAGDFREWGREQWLTALNANMLTAIDLIQAVVDGMRDRGFGRIVNITSSSVKAPIEILGLSNGARGGLTGFVAGIAKSPDFVRKNVTINNLLPGTFDTDRIAQLMDEPTRVKKAAESVAGRFGDPAEFGDACAFLCGANSGYITGQNLLIDGGSYRGVF